MPAYVQFEIGSQCYALPVAVIVEVLHLVEVTPIPEQAADYLGTMTLRGRVIPVIDLGQLYRGTPTELHVNTPMMVLTYEDQMAAVVVDRVRDVVSLDGIPEPTAGDVIQGVLRYEDETVLVPNLDVLFVDRVVR